MQASELYILQGKGVLHRLHGGAALQVDAEFGVDLPGADELVCVGVDARGDPQGHRSHDSPLFRRRLDQVQLLQVVRHNVPHAVLYGEGKLLDRLVVPLEVDALPGNAGLQGGVQLPAGHHLHVQPLAEDDAVDLFAAKGFAGVDGLAVAAVKPLEGGHIAAAGLAHLVLAHYVEGGAVLLRQLHRVAAADGQMAFFVQIQTGRDHGFHLFLSRSNLRQGRHALGDALLDLLQPRALHRGEGRKGDLALREQLLKVGGLGGGLRLV